MCFNVDCFCRLELISISVMCFFNEMITSSFNSISSWKLLMLCSLKRFSTTQQRRIWENLISFVCILLALVLYCWSQSPGESSNNFGIWTPLLLITINYGYEIAHELGALPCTTENDHNRYSVIYFRSNFFPFKLLDYAINQKSDNSYNPKTLLLITQFCVRRQY